MKRAACAGGLLLVCGWLQGRAGSHGAAFSYRGTENGEGVLVPMVPPRVGVQLAKGPRELNKGEILTGCKEETKTRKVIDNGEAVEATELWLICGEREFVVKSLHFEEF